MEFRAFRVHVEGDRDKPQITRRVERLQLSDLPPGEVTIRVAYSSLNYKDALSASGHRGVTRNYPHTPGIDAAGTVLSSADPRFAEGDAVLVTGFDLGMNTPGGFGEVIRVPAAWVLPLPAGLSLREAMILGTAGLTAALSLDALEHHGVRPEHGPLVVTGASGGVGSLAVALAAGQGYEVIASSGKTEAHELLRRLGADRVQDRGELSEATERPLLEAGYGAGIDTVGGHTLENVIKRTRYGGAVAACGLVQSPALQLTVYPFILRAVSLLGIDSAECPRERRQRLWQQLAGPWRIEQLEALAHEVTLDELENAIETILAGRSVGRVLVRVAGEPA